MPGVRVRHRTGCAAHATLLFVGDQRFGGGDAGAGGDGLDAVIDPNTVGVGGPGFLMSRFFAGDTRFGTGGSGFGPFGSLDPGSGGVAATAVVAVVAASRCRGTVGTAS